MENPSVPEAVNSSLTQHSVANALESVTARLQFATKASEKSDPFAHHSVQIHNARAEDSERSLDQDGFILRHEGSAVSDVYDKNEVTQVFYPEVQRLVAGITGAKHVIVFTHAVRCAPKAAKGDPDVQSPFRFVHNDYTANSGPARAREVLGRMADNLMQYPFSIINVWRPIRGPVQDAPLAVCNTRTVSPADVISIPSRDPSGRQIRIYTLIFNPHQRWSYFPMMKCNELLLFKTFDSLADGRARYTFHSAFDDPNTPPDAPARESIEARALAIFL